MAVFDPNKQQLANPNKGLAGTVDPNAPVNPGANFNGSDQFQPDTSGSPTWQDQARNVAAGATDVGASLASGIRHIDNAVGGEGSGDYAALAEHWFQDSRDDLKKGITPAGKRVFEAAIGSDEFWKHPVATTTAKALGMTPYVAAAIIPGGLVADGLTALSAAAATGAVLNASAGTEAVDNQIDNASDIELQKQSQYYRGLRGMGIDEDSARDKLALQMDGFAPLINGIAGGVVSLFGPAGNIARGGVAAAGKGIIKRTLAGAAEGSAGMAAQSGIQNVQEQQAEIEQGFKKKFDNQEFNQSLIDSAVMGGVAGAATGIVSKGETSPKKTSSTSVEKTSGVAADQAAALNATAAPAPNPTEIIKAATDDLNKSSAAPGQPVAPRAAEGVQPAIQSVAKPDTAAQQGTPAGSPAADATTVNSGPTDQAGTQASTVAETPETLAAQRDKLVAGQRDVVMYPKGTTALPKPTKLGIKRVAVGGDIYDYNSTKITPKQIRDAAKAGNVNELLGLAPDNKAEVAAKAAQGDQPVAVSEITPQGNEVASGLANQSTAPEAAADIEQQATPGNQVVQTTPKAVIDNRVSNTPITGDAVSAAPAAPAAPHASPKDDHITALNEYGDFFRSGKTYQADRVEHDAIVNKIMKLSPDKKAARSAMASVRQQGKADRIQMGIDNGAEPPVKGKNWTKAEKTKRQADAAASEKIVTESNVPDLNIPRVSGEMRTELMAEIESMLRKSQRDNVKIPTKVGYEGTSPHVMFLRDAAQMYGRLKRSVATKQDVLQFIGDWHALKKGDGEPLKARRDVVGEDRSPVTAKAPKSGKDGGELEAEQPAAHEETPPGAAESVENQNPEEHAIAREEAQSESDEAGINKDTQEKLAQPVENKQASNDGAHAGQSPSAGKFKVETKKRPRAGARPSKGLNADDDFFSDAKPVEAKDTVSTHTVQDVYGKPGAHNFSEPKGNAIGRYVTNAVMRRLASVYPDMEIHIVKDSAMPRSSQGNAADGVFDPRTGSILIHEQYAHDGVIDGQVLAHEAIHALTEHALYVSEKGDGELYGHVSQLVQLAKDAGVKGYGLKDPHEFLAEALSNPEFQDALNNIQVPDKLAREMGLDKPTTSADGKPLTIWQALVDKVRQVLGIIRGRQQFNALEAAMKAVEKADAIRHVLDQKADRQEESRPTRQREQQGMSHEEIDDRSNKFAGNILDRVRNSISERQVKGGKMHLLKLRSTDHIVRGADRFFGGADRNPLRRVEEAMTRMRHAAQSYLEKNEPFLEKLYAMEQKHAGKAWDDYVDLQTAASVLDIHPDVSLGDSRNSHVKSSLSTSQSRAQHAKLEAQFNQLPQELKQLWKDSVKFYADQQNQMIRKLLENRILKTLNTGLSPADVKDIAQRFMDNKETKADIAKIGESNYAKIRDVDELRSVKGPYFPQMRRGDIAVSGKLTLPEAKGTDKGKSIDDRVKRFDTQAAAEAYANQMFDDHGMKAKVRKVYVDKNTGDTVFKDEQGEVPVTPQDADAEPRYDVKVQNNALEFHDDIGAANKAAESLREQGFSKVSVEPKKFQPGRNEAGMGSNALRKLLDKSGKDELFKDLPQEQRRDLQNTLTQLGYQLNGATAIQSRRAPRQHVLGASKDLSRNAADYSVSMSNYLAKLDHQPALDKALLDTESAIDDGRGTEASYGQRQAANEVLSRIDSKNTLTNNLHPNVHRLLTVSFLDKLMSPSHSIVNSTQVLTNTVPWLASRHGWAPTVAAVTKAYRTIGGARILKSGVKNTIEAIKNGAAADIMKPLRERLSGNENYVKLFDYLVEHGKIGHDAGLEVVKAIKAYKGIGGKVDQGLGYAENIARALPQAVEVNNRMATALATFDLELKRNGGDVEKAMRKAVDAVNLTQFDYGVDNSPNWMKHPLAKLTLQFKKYAVSQYQYMAEQAVQAIKGAPDGTRLEAVKALGYHFAMVSAFAGVLGLPTEPLKLALMAANLFGVTSYSVDDWERDVRRAAAAGLGQRAGEALTRGLPHLIGVDLSSRMSEGDLLTFGAPKGDKIDDWKSWAFDTAAGAPAAQALEWVSGVNALSQGDYLKAAQAFNPIKTLTDPIKAYQLATQGKKSSKGKQTLAPVKGYQAAIQALGFTPSVVSENRERQDAYYTNAKKYSAARSEALTKAVAAKTPGEALKIIAKFNAGVDRAGQLRYKDVKHAQANARKIGKTIDNGISATRRTKQFVDDSTYGTGN